MNLSAVKRVVSLLCDLAEHFVDFTPGKVDDAAVFSAVAALRRAFDIIKDD